APGTFHNQITADNVAATVVVKGQVYSSDLQHATGKDFAIRTIKTLDLSGVEIIAQNNGYEANVVNHPFFVTPNAASYAKSVVEKIILPDNVVRISANIFSNCGNIKEITLPTSLRSIPVKNAKNVNEFGIGVEAFDGCPNLSVIRIPGKPGELDGRMIVAHFNPGATTNAALKPYYHLGHPDSQKVTVIVPEEYLDVYRTAYNDTQYGNPWKFWGYNILSEKPVYNVNFDPTRVKATEGTDVSAMASFLGDNVALESISTEGKLMLVNPQAKCKIFDNGVEIQANEDGTIPVTFYNPAKNADKAGHHN
ncbi:MAG: leucine-rich repeat domain-containing protein, partial [Muribaculaceae bacterium]|nr:leucine-rich repeat domain-containing protein [Muribaculaceae bacterium]